MKKLDGNYTRMLRAILNKSWRQHPQDTNYTATCLPSRKLYKLEEPDTQDTAGDARMNSSVMYSYGPPHMAKQKQDNQLEHIYSSYVRIRDVTLKTCQKRWMIGRSGERGSGISMLASRHDDDTPARTHSFGLSSAATENLTLMFRFLDLNKCFFQDIFVLEVFYCSLWLFCNLFSLQVESYQRL